MDDREARTAMLMPLMGIRFIAVMATVTHHTAVGWLVGKPWIPQLLSQMVLHFNMGLGFFFILSGFILQSLYRGRLTGTGARRRYLVSRIARIYPLFLLGMLAAAPFTGSLHWKALPQLLLIQSWPGHDNTLGWENWNAPTWMLSVELFFYLCFPLICRFVKRAPRAVLIGGIAAATVFIFATGSVNLPFAAPNFAWVENVPLPLVRLPDFIAGAMMAELQVRRGVRQTLVPPELWLLAFAVVLGWTAFPSQAAVVVVLATFVMLGLVNSPRAPFTRLMNTKLFMLLGAASYSLYIIHEPVNFALRSVVERWWMLLQYPISIGLSVVLLLWVETPARRWINTHFSPKEKPPLVEEQAAVSPVAAA